MMYPYVPQSGPEFVPLNPGALPPRTWLGVGLVLLVLTIIVGGLMII